MPLFAIDRDSSQYADEDTEVLSLRVQGCAARFPNMRWIRSFGDDTTQTSICIYEADSAADLEEHARMSGISCLRVREVTEWTPAIIAEQTASDEASAGS